MKDACLMLIALGVLIVCAGETLAQSQAQQKEQAALDAACEVARNQKIAAERANHIEECVEKKQRPDRASCERFYADYGQRVGARPPLYYDLPECEAADAFRRSYRGT